MSPVPEDNRDKPPSGDRDDSEIGHFSNPNLVVSLEESDSSDDDNADDINSGVPYGYSLLPQEPGDNHEDDDSDEEASSYPSNNAGDGHHGPQASSVSTTEGEDAIPVDSLPEAVISSEAGASAPTVSVSKESHHPAFLAKFPDGRVPSYMQVPSLPRNKDGILWNQQRQETNKLPLDSAQESKILKAMSSFKLPTANIPDWAKDLPEDQWQQQILHRIGTTGEKEEGEKEEGEKEEKSSEGGNKEQEAQSCSSSDSSWVADFSEANTSQH